jgi:hypothetical protein
MTEMDDLVPLDFLVFELPAGARSYPRNVVREVTRLSEAEFIRVVQLAMVSRGTDGVLTISDPGEAIGADAQAAALDEHLLAEGLGQAVEKLAPGRVMGVLLYESLWANPLASAVRRSGGEWMGRGRL